MATGNTKAERGSSVRNSSDRPYQKRTSQAGERGGFRNTEGKPYHKPKDGARPYRPRYDKDEEESGYKRGGKGNEHKNSRSQASRDSAKIKEQQPDKMDIVKRLEKEKKAMQKKNNNQNSTKNKGNAGRVQRPVKRSNNIDWTREYENDSYDDDDMSYMY